MRPLRNYYARKYAGREDRWITINNYDGDIQMVLDRSTYIGGSIYWLGYHHRWELDYLRRTLKPDMTFVDAGANQGEFTLFAAKRVYQGAVLAFEPEDNMFEALEKNICLNQFNNVRLFHCGLGNTDSCARLYTSRDTMLHSGWNEGLFTVCRSEYTNDYVQEIEIKRFDEVLAQNAIERLDVMKVDVEGAELAVLKGAEETLKSFKPKILLEINENSFRHAGYSTVDLMEFLQRLEYRFFKFLCGGNLEELPPIPKNSTPSSFNILCQ